MIASFFSFLPISAAVFFFSRRSFTMLESICALRAVSGTMLSSADSGKICFQPSLDLNTQKITHRRQNLRFGAANHSEFELSRLVHPRNVPARVRSSVSNKATFQKLMSGCSVQGVTSRRQSDAKLRSDSKLLLISESLERDSCQKWLEKW